MENISGHGWLKMMRSKRPLRYRISQMLPIPEVFSFYAERIGVPIESLLNVFNMGAGFMIVARSSNDAAAIVACAKELGLEAVVAGQTEATDKGREVVVEPLGVVFNGDGFVLAKG
jgi:phosphoribosylformylglycinamidine cyclo-ligase